MYKKDKAYLISTFPQFTHHGKTCPLRYGNGTRIKVYIIEPVPTVFSLNMKERFEPRKLRYFIEVT
jgi:hypothetical protein